jgi:TP901 family phage tail tape measure protein
LNKSGAAAKLAKMSFSELIASIEGVATSFPSAEVAGTKLNAVFVKLEAQTNNNFKPSVVGLIPALRNLEAANLSAADKVKLFGQGNLVAAEALIKNRDTIAQMNTALQEHGTALQMAETNADTLEGKWNKLKNAFSTLFAELGQSEIIKFLVDALEALCVVLTKAIQIIGKILHPFLEFFNWINKIGNALI